CECLQVVFGLYVREVDPRDRTYVLVPTLGLTWDAVLSDGQSTPEAGLLVMVLGVITLFGDRAPEEEVWGCSALSKLGLRARRELLTEVWVQAGYLKYQQVPHSDPARYEFLWGPRAYAEASKWQVLEHLLRVNSMDPRFFPSVSAESMSDEEEGASARAAASPTSSSFSRGAGRGADSSL
ncbi:LOW QUALITY PROTEIN: melanoma-associated antigen 1, partial [Neophocaena asiaeorientalis asiaeorientalis]|uniref:LOW QUALITY PROTEIN: melanoma-associated antigen 1 n=1 Tax=Neophocaena asiaeorientalis asiaeorientalis TaxID=1706337 RepID=A0A341CAK2_NEOAA